MISDGSAPAAAARFSTLREFSPTLLRQAPVWIAAGRSMIFGDAVAEEVELHLVVVLARDGNRGDVRIAHQLVE